MTSLPPPPLPISASIEEMVRDIPGWSPLDQLYTLATLTLTTTHLPGDVVEIGSWCGRSAVVLGTAARLAGRAMVHCIDLFPRRSDWRQNPDGSYYFEVEIGGRAHRAHRQQTVWASAFESQTSRIYETYDSPLQCLEQQIARFGLGDLIRIHHGTSQTFAACCRPDFRCKLAFIDGDHGYDAVTEDILFLKSRLVPGGWLCFDDAFSCYEGVDNAISDHVLADPAFDVRQQMTRKLFVARKRPAGA
jgi:predicted O-methyltransferase YrrM